jgi:hypothetical protein
MESMFFANNIFSYTGLGSSTSLNYGLKDLKELEASGSKSSERRK